MIAFVNVYMAMFYKVKVHIVEKLTSVKLTLLLGRSHFISFSQCAAETNIFSSQSPPCSGAQQNWLCLLQLLCGSLPSLQPFL